MGLFYTGSKNYVTNYTGLGDDQMTELTTNQSGIADQSQQGFDAVGLGLTNLGTKVDGVNTNTDSGFVDLKAVLQGYEDVADSNRTTAALDRSTNYGNIIEALKNNTGGLATQASLDTGFADATGRFNTLDTSVGNVQSAVDTGFQDATNQRELGFAADLIRRPVLGALASLAFDNAVALRDFYPEHRRCERRQHVRIHLHPGRCLALLRRPVLDVEGEVQTGAPEREREREWQNTAVDVSTTIPPRGLTTCNAIRAVFVCTKWWYYSKRSENMLWEASAESKSVRTQPFIK